MRILISPHTGFRKFLKKKKYSDTQEFVSDVADADVVYPIYIYIHTYILHSWVYPSDYGDMDIFL